MFICTVLSSVSFLFLQLLSSYITKNSKSTNSQRFYCQSFTLLCSVWHYSCRFCSWGDVPLETPPPSGRAPSPPTDSVSQRLRILPEISWQKTKQKKDSYVHDQNGAFFEILCYNVWFEQKRVGLCTSEHLTSLCRRNVLIGNPEDWDYFWKINKPWGWGYLRIVLLLCLHTG